MTRDLVLCCLLLVPLAELGAYVGFDDVLVIEPMWTSLPSEPLGASTGIAYRIVPVSAQRVVVEMRNRSNAIVEASLRLPEYQVAETPETMLRVAPGATASVAMAVQRADRDCTENAVRFTRIVVGAQSLALRPPAGALPPHERAFAVRTTWESPAFRADALAYTLAVTDDHTIDVHVLNRSAQCIHAEFRVDGWQNFETVNPRLHLLPGSTTEVLVRGEAVNERVTAAALAIWAVRVGADAGPASGESAADVHGLAAIGEGWLPIASAQDSLAGFNPRTLLHRFVDGELEIRNRSLVSIGAQVTISGGVAVKPYALTLAPGAVVHLPTPKGHGSAVTADRVALAGVPVVAEPLTIMPAPANALPAIASPADPHFNPLTVVYAIARHGDSEARVTIANRAAVALHGTWRLPAYQGSIINPRLHLAAGASATYVISIGHTDARLPLAQLALSEVRLGEDAGAMWCVLPAAASP